jgi:Fe-S oxidoreductase
MKIAFAYPAFENLGIEYISALLKENGHKTFLLFDPQLFSDPYLKIQFLARMFDYRKSLMKEVARRKPDVVAFSVVSDNFAWACSYAENIKREYPHMKIVFGGQHITAVPRNVLANWFVDFVIVGEGEYPMLELIQALDIGTSYENIENLGYKKQNEIFINETRPLLQDLNKLPFPDVDLFLDANPYAKKEYNIIAARGCVNNCSYCHNSMDRNLLWKNCGKFLRRRSIDNIIAELRERKEKYEFDTLCIWDEVFTCDEKWLEKFSEVYKREINVPFWTFVHPKHITEKTVKLLEEMGCWEAEMGVQTLNQNVKDNILHRYETREEVIKAIELFRSTKIRLVVDVIFGLPQLKAEDYIELIDTFNQHRPTKIQTFWLRYYPGTDIIPIAKEKGLITKDEVYEINEGIPERAAASGGSKIDPALLKFQTILTFLPLLSTKKVNKFLLKTRENKKNRLPNISRFGHLITRILDLRNKKDVGGRRYKGRMKYFMIKKVFYAGRKRNVN